MKRMFVFSLGLLSVLSACNNNAGDSTATTSTDTMHTEQSNAAAAPAGDQAANTGTGAQGSGTLKGMMDKMMQDMHQMQMSKDPDHDFATMMKRHHEGAIEMANIELAQGVNDELKQVAQKIISDSQKDIGELNSFLSSHQPSKNSDFAQKQMDKMMKTMDMKMEHGGDVDKEFAVMMAMHHQHGIDMARDYLKVGTAEPTKKVANNTIKSNSEDLKKLKAHSGAGSAHTGHVGSQEDKSGSKKEAEKAADHSQHQ